MSGAYRALVDRMEALMLGQRRREGKALAARRTRVGAHSCVNA
jgi:hypothetical protein